MRLSLGYPDADSERALLAGDNRRSLLERLAPVLDKDKLLAIQQHVVSQHVSAPLIDYIQKLLDHSRHSSDFAVGLSPRAGLGLLQAAKSWSVLHGRNHVIPEDVQAVLEAVTGHRLGTRPSGESIPSESTQLLLEAVPIP